MQEKLEKYFCSCGVSRQCFWLKIRLQFFFHKINEIKLCNICFESATFPPSFAAISSTPAQKQDFINFSNFINILTARNFTVNDMLTYVS